jgi:hypothetical protein
LAAKCGFVEGDARSRRKNRTTGQIIEPEEIALFATSIAMAKGRTPMDCANSGGLCDLKRSYGLGGE